MEKLSVPIAIVIAGGLIAGALYYSNLKTADQRAIESTRPILQEVTGDMRPITAEDHILGNPNADIIIVEYSDTECPFCKAFHPTMQRVMTEYGKSGKVAWVYRHFPIEQLHSKAPKEAEALECAAELGGQEKFWQYTDLLYKTTNSNDSLNSAELPRMAGEVGLDINDFSACLSSGRHAARVQADYDDAVKAGARGTPTSILLTKDGSRTMVQGAQPYDSLKLTIDALLEE